MTMARVSSMRCFVKKHIILSTVLKTSSCNFHLSKTRYQEPKPFSDIPGPKGLPVIGTLLDIIRYETNGIHKYSKERFDTYGPIFREKAGPYNSLNLHDPDDIKVMLKHEGKYPERTEFLAWVMHRRMRQLPFGLLLSNGEEWQEYRSATNQHLMRPQSVASHTEVLNDVVTEFMEVLDKAVHEGNGTVLDLRDKCFRWSFESGCTIIFEERLGGLKPNPPQDMISFIDALIGVLMTTEVLLLFPPQLAKALRLPSWKKHCKYWDDVFEFGGKLVKDKIAKIQLDLKDGKEVSGLIGSFVTAGMTEKSVVSNCIDLMGGAVDTTSTAMLWMLYLLSKNPDQQQLLWDEISRTVPSGESTDQTHLRDMPYLKAVVKETLRLYPVAAFVSRIMPEDVIIRGYKIPKGVIVNIPLWNMSRDPQLYTDPESFKPERWLRENSKEETIHPFAHLSFGHGPRSCIGRRLAELEMYLLLTRVCIPHVAVNPPTEEMNSIIMQKYKIIDGKPGHEMDSENRVVLVPKTPLDIIFQVR